MNVAFYPLECVQVATFIPADVGFELLNVMMVRVLRVGGRCRETDPAEPL
jgi:hypothetical protein